LGIKKQVDKQTLFPFFNCFYTLKEQTTQVSKNMKKILQKITRMVMFLTQELAQRNDGNAT